MHCYHRLWLGACCVGVVSSHAWAQATAEKWKLDTGQILEIIKKKDGTFSGKLLKGDEALQPPKDGAEGSLKFNDPTGKTGTLVKPGDSGTIILQYSLCPPPHQCPGTTRTIKRLE